MRSYLPRPARLTASAFNLLAGLFLLFLVCLTVADVVSRNVQGRSILGTIDISTMLMVAIAFLGLGAAEINGKHVAVSLLEERLPSVFRALFSVLRFLLLLSLGALLLWGLTDVFQSALDRGETTNDVLRLPTAPWKLILLISFAVFFLLALWQEARRFLSFRAEMREKTEKNDAESGVEA